MTSESASLASIDEDARRRFEAAWRAGNPIPIEQVLPPPEHLCYRATLEELVLIELEMVWKRWGRPTDDTAPSPPPPLEAYLTRFPLLNQPSIVARLLQQEFRMRRLHGDRPSAEEYRTRFPGLFLPEIEIDETLPGNSAPAEARSHVPGYEVLSVLGHGGMGVVYKACQLRPNRVVALKMMRAGVQASPEDRIRFLSEAEAVARLQHPHIVQIYEVSQEKGQPFFSMEFVAGGSLADKLRGGLPLQPRPAAQLVETLARAVDHAHRQGIVHRDLKPANVLLTAEGTPKVSDFGLAKHLEMDSGLTQTGAILGSPSYMAPEQASGKAHRVGPGTDVYALGAILYELLTGRPPFQAATVLDTLDQVRTQEPVPPTRLQPKVPLDLETICLKCLQKDPPRRYASAAGLADDLLHFLKDEPIQARPVSSAERLQRWCRRNPVVASLLATVAALLVMIAAGATIAALRLARIADEANQARHATEVTLADMHASHGLMAFDQGDVAQAVLWFAEAARLARRAPEREQANRVRVRTWGRLIPTPLRALEHSGQRLAQLAFHPGGKHLLTVTSDDHWTVWDLAAEQPLPWAGGEGKASCAAWSPDGQALVLGTLDGDVEIRSFPSGEVRQRLTHPRPLLSLAFSGDGHWLALGSRVVRLWDLRQQAFAAAELVHPKPVVALRFNDSNDRLATTAADDLARVFAVPGDAAAVKPLFPPVPHLWQPEYSVRPVAPLFVDGGRGLVTIANKAQAAWWDAETGTQIAPVPFTKGSLLLTVATEPQGRYVVLGGHSGAQVWDTRRRAAVGPFLEHSNYVTALAVSPDGNQLLTVSEDRKGRRWLLPGGEPLGPPLPHQASLNLAAFAPDGLRVATAQRDGLVRIWAPPTGNPNDHHVSLGGSPTFATLSPDGRHVLATGAGWWPGTLRTTRVYEVATGQPAGPPLELGGLLTNTALSPTGRQAVTLTSLAASREERDAPEVLPEGKAGRLQFWDWSTGTPLFDPLPMPSEPRGIAYSPDGRLVVALCTGGQGLMIDPANGQVMRRFEHCRRGRGNNTYPSVGFAPDGQSFVTWGPDEKFRVWETATGQPRYGPLAHESQGYAATFSRDGRWLVTSSWDNTARVWDVATGQPAAEPLRHPEWLFSVCFSNDGDHVLTACRDGMARLWSWRSGQLACPPFRHKDAVFMAAFTPDERWVVTASRDGTARAWSRHTGKPVTPPWSLGNGGGVWNALITPDGHYAVLAGSAAALTAVDLSDLRAGEDLDLNDLCVLGEILSGQRLQEGDVEGLTTQDWLGRWRDFRERHPDFGSQEGGNPVPALVPPR
jgi:WD40 repeat protein/predicted Ser/Thr protein kinase